MSYRAYLSLVLLLAAGCAADKLIVAESDWQVVPPAQRAKLDRQSQAELDDARAEVKLATKRLAEVEHAPPDPKVVGKPSATQAATGNAAWASEDSAHDRARGQALSKIDAAAAAKRQAELIWHQRWVEAARDRVEMAEAQRELARGQAIDRNLLGEDTYETAPLRGQFSKAQVRWYNAASAADKARDDFERAARALTSAKDAYAELMRNGPGNSMAEYAAPEPPKDPFALPSWEITRLDIRRKNGKQHFIEQAVSTKHIQTPRLHISKELMSAKPPNAVVKTASAEP